MSSPGNYFSFPLDSHATQALPHLQQDLDELLEMFLHHASELLLKIYHTSDMSQISAEGLNHYIVMYGLNSRKLRENVLGD